MARFRGPLASAGWVREHRAEVVLADVRWYLDGRSGRDAFAAGHLPGAVFVDLDADLSATAGAPATAGRHPLPAPEAFAAAMSRLGIGDTTAVVAYDDSGGGTAARLVWMLRVTGHDAALLDGGLAAWDGEREPGPGRNLPAATFTPVPWPAGALASADDVAALEAWPGSRAVLLDARSAERFRGDTESVDARAGHVPGARNAPWLANLDAATGRFLAPAALRERFEALGVTGGAEVVAYCGSGVSACANLVALEAAGFEGAKLFAASWSGWSADPQRPVATGAA